MTENTATGPLKHETTMAIEKQLRILGYSRGTVEWDGAMAAARAYAEHTTHHGQTVTLGFETAQRLFDLATDSPLMCSGSFETEDVIVLRELATAIDLDPAKATPNEFVRDFPHPFKPFDIRIEHEWLRDESQPNGMRLETDAEVYARLGELPDRCSAGGYSSRCRRPANDPFHQAAEMGA